MHLCNITCKSGILAFDWKQVKGEGDQLSVYLIPGKWLIWLQLSPAEIIQAKVGLFPCFACLRRKIFPLAIHFAYTLVCSHKM